MKFRFLVLFLLLYFSNRLFATHIVGGELSYRYIGDEKYIFTMKVYRDCFNGIPPFDNPSFLAIYSSNNTLMQLVGIEVPGSRFLPLNSLDGCTGVPENVCVEEAILSDTIRLPIISGGYHITYQRCCRNKTILNIIDPQWTGATYTVFISEEQLLLNNSSPFFKNLPPVFICNELPFVFDHSAIDPDGDSLSYELCTPFHGADTANPQPVPAASPPYQRIDWRAPYNVGDMLGGIPMKIDSKTGILTARPNRVGQFVVGVCVSEYRKGRLISTKYRDFQFNVADCPSAPYVSLPGSMQSCGLTFKLPNNSFRASTFYWDFGVNGIESDTSRDEFPVYTFPKPGKYLITLIINKGTACSDTGTAFIEVFFSTKGANFKTKDDCLNKTISFTDLTVLTDGVVSRWNWNFGDGTISTLQNPTHDYSNAGTYTVMLTSYNANGCSDTIYKPVIIFPLPNVKIKKDTIICFGETTTLTGEISSSKYEWIPTIGLSCINCLNPTVTITKTQKYFLKGTNEFNCDKLDSATIRIQPLPVAYAGPDTAICFNEIGKLKATGGVKYKWNKSSQLSCLECNNPFVNVKNKDNYIVTVYDSLGCNAKDSVIVDVKPLPKVIAGPDTSICLNDSIFLKVNGANTYNWTSTAFIKCSTCAITKGQSFINTEFKVEGIGLNGCRDYDSIQLTINPLPIIEMMPDSTVCFGDTAFLHARTNANTYKWTPSADLDCKTCINTKIYVPTTSKFYFEVEDILACKNKDSVTITIRELPLADAGFDTLVCVLQPTQLRANGGLKYNWSSKTVSISCTSCQNPWVRIAEKAAFKVRVFDDIGCFADDSVEFSTKPLPVVIAGPDTAICPSKEAFLYASGAIDYKWLPSNLVNCERCAFTIGKPFTTTVFTVIGTAENGCENSDSTIVSIKPLPNANAGPDSLICYGASAFLHASGGVSYEWSPTNLVPCVKCKTNFVTPTSLTNYYVMVKGANGCFKSDTVSINVRSLRAPKARFEANHPRCAPGKSVFRGELYDYDTICRGEVEWLWDFGDGNFARIANPSHIYESPGEFLVTVNVKNAESYQANVSILHPDSCLKNIYIPNTFTPNKDGQNDLLYVRGINITKLLFRLYNSWGEEIYRTTSLKEGWDGTYKGKVLSTQTFVFTCDATFYDGSTVFKTGNITLVE